MTIISQTAIHVKVTEDAIGVDLSDGRSITVPLDWFPRLLNGAPEERNNWRIIGCGAGIHWPDLDEDISIAGLLLRRPSKESRTSFNKWLQHRLQNE